MKNIPNNILKLRLWTKNSLKPRFKTGTIYVLFQENRAGIYSHDQ